MFNLMPKIDFSIVSFCYCRLSPYCSSTITGYLNSLSVAVRSKAWICGRSLTGTVGSNPTGGMDVCLLRVLCVVR